MHLWLMTDCTAPLHVVWFKRDLRVFDHAALADAAAAAAADGAAVLPLYVVEDAQWGAPTASGRQWRFVAEALEALRAETAVLGAPLAVRRGEALAVLQ
ncbi:MAG: deoxyribodipyrimidine photo-lyase, partial [Pseudomonadota bacterium]